ncbi:MAG: CoA transferase [Chloroflexota bacterium]
MTDTMPIPDVTPLQGLRVLELGGSVSAALCTRLLAAFGADVLKLGPAKDHPSAASASPPTTRSLLSAHLDLGKWGIRQTATTAQTAIAWADVVVDGTRLSAPGAIPIDHAPLLRSRPDLIWAGLSWFGDSGPYRDFLGGEIVLMALGGLMNLIGEPDRQPLKLGGNQAQQAVGLSAFSGILTALWERDRSGRGQYVEVPGLDTIASLEWKSPTFYQYDGKVRRRGGRGVQWLVVRCADGFLALVYMDKDWPQVKELVGDSELDAPEFASRAERVASRERLLAVVERWSHTRPKSQIYHAAQRLGIPAGAVLSVSDLLDTPQYSARALFDEIDHPVLGRLRYPGVPVTFNGRRPRLVRAPLPAEHDAATLSPRAGRTSPGRNSPRGLPLEGLRVLDLGTITAGANVSQILADFGARVIKVESAAHPDPFRFWTSGIAPKPGQERLWDAAPTYNAVNRNKLGVSLDTRTNRGREAFLALVRESDVLVENYRRGVMEKLGFDFATLVRANPRIVRLALSSQGADGPESRYASYGSTLDALSGLMSITGYDADTPTWSSSDINYPDQVASLLGAGVAITAARHARQCNTPLDVDLAQRELVTWLIGEYVLAAQTTGTAAEPTGNTDQSDAAIQDAFPCLGEDGWVAISIETDQHWRGLCAAMERADLGNDPRYRGVADRLRHRDAAHALIAAWTRTLGKRQAMDRLQAHGVPAGAVNDGRDLLADPHLRARGFYQPLQHPVAGETIHRAWAFRLAATPASIRAPAPCLGQHTRHVLAETLGYPSAEIESMIADGTIGFEPLTVKLR